MKTLQTLTLTALMALAASAFAASAEYTEGLKRIDAALAAGQMAPTTTDEVRKLRAESERMMKAGKEAEAMKLLEKARQLLATR